MNENFSKREKTCFAWFVVACLGLALLVIGKTSVNAVLGTIMLVGGGALHLLYQENKPITLLRVVSYSIAVFGFCLSAATALLALGIILAMNDFTAVQMLVVSAFSGR